MTTKEKYNELRISEHPLRRAIVIWDLIKYDLENASFPAKFGKIFIHLGTFDNCREQGLTIYCSRGYDNKHNCTIMFSEARNSDNIVIFHTDKHYDRAFESNWLEDLDMEKNRQFAKNELEAVQKIKNLIVAYLEFQFE